VDPVVLAAVVQKMAEQQVALEIHHLLHRLKELMVAQQLPAAQKVVRAAAAHLSLAPAAPVLVFQNSVAPVERAQLVQLVEAVSHMLAAVGVVLI
jgi:hypothetical protein